MSTSALTRPASATVAPLATAASPGPTEPPPATLRGVPFAQRLAHFGARAAVVLPDRTVDYTELARQVDDVAARLGPDPRLAVLAADNTLGSLVAYLACLATGHPLAVVPADKPETLEALVAAYAPDVVLRGGGEATLIEARHPGSAHDRHPELALLMSTSGSTGSPKLVRLSAANVQANAESIAEYLRIGPGDRAATTLPLSYCYGLSVVNSHLLRGASLVLTELSVVDPCFWEAFRAAGATSFAAVPYTFELLERVGFGAMDLPSLRCVTQAGGRLAPEVVRRYARLGAADGWELFVMYGQTEATARMAYLPPQLAAERPDAIGVPVPGGTFRIEPVDGLEDGELVYSGPNTMLGYAESPADLALGRVVDELRTGDLARLGDDGLYRIVGRRSRFVKIVGLRVDLGRVEALLADLGVDAAATGADERLVVAAAGEHDGGLLAKDLAGRLGLPRRSVAVHPVVDLPRLSNGKIDYPAVRALDAPLSARPWSAGPSDAGFGSRGGGPAALGPAGPAAVASGPEDVRSVFADTLDVDPHSVKDGDSFVSLGGDSLSYVAASIRLEQLLGHLPADWHVTPVSRLVPLSAPPVPGRHRNSDIGSAAARALRMAPLESGIALRAVAIVAIVSSHVGLLDFQGTAHVLMALCGFNFARFHLAGGRLPRLRRQLVSLARIVVPSVAFIGVAVLVSPDKYEWYNVALLNAFLGPTSIGNTWNFWFIELLVYILVCMAALLAVPWVDRTEWRFPFAVPVGLLAIGLVPRFGILDVPAPHTMPVLWLFALGWAAARARTLRHRLLLTAIAAASTPNFFADDPSRNAVILAGILVMVWVPVFHLPALLHRPIGVLAMASVYAYLAHWLIYPPLVHHGAALAVAASLVGGIAYWAVSSRAMRRLERFAARARPTA
ncbi:AMP-binding protein [Arthrobacter sp. KK5.5]|uniref:AMP-binding protein n=1 Tax=Arthrobacter sp. KK5.5 TaxID=3373084 RepID=UPI003EE5AEAE